MINALVNSKLHLGLVNSPFYGRCFMVLVVNNSQLSTLRNILHQIILLFDAKRHDYIPRHFSDYIKKSF